MKDHKSIQSLIARAEAWAQEELRAQRAMLTTLRRQEEALLAGNANVLEECGAEIGTVMAAGPERARHRDRLMAALAGAMDLKGDEVHHVEPRQAMARSLASESLGEKQQERTPKKAWVVRVASLSGWQILTGRNIRISILRAGVRKPS